MKKYLVAIAALSLSGQAEALTNPATLLMRVYEVRISANSDCSNSVSIFKTDSPTAMDFAAGPTLGSGALPLGTYHCMAVHLSDILTFTPEANDGLCIAGTSYTTDIFNSPADGDVSVDPVTGATISGTGDPISSPVEDDPWAYFSDAAGASSSNNCWRPSVVSAGQGPCQLSALPITSDQSRTLVYDFDGVVGDYGDGHCHLHPPVVFIR